MKIAANSQSFLHLQIRNEDPQIPGIIAYVNHRGGGGVLRICKMFTLFQFVYLYDSLHCTALDRLIDLQIILTYRT